MAGIGNHCPSKVGPHFSPTLFGVVFAGGIIGFVAALIIVYLWLPNVQLKYQIALAIAIGLFPGLLVGVAITSKMRNKK